MTYPTFQDKITLYRRNSQNLIKIFQKQWNYTGILISS